MERHPPVSLAHSCMQVGGQSLSRDQAGVGYIVVHEDNQQGTQSDPTLLNWPLGGTKHKTPSRIAYDDDNSRGRLYWGFNVKPGMTACSWTKLLLNRSADRTEFDDEVLEAASALGILRLPARKNAVHVAADFMREVYQYVRRELRTEFQREPNNIPIEFWLPIPAGWSGQAQSALKEAATLAGFGQQPQHELVMMTE